METVHHEHLLLGRGVIEGRYHLAGETLAPRIHGSDAEGIEPIGLELDGGVCAIAVEEGAIIKVPVILCCVEHIACRHGRWLQGVFHGRPRELSGTLVGQNDADIVGCQGLYHIVGMVHAGRIAQQGLIDAPRHVETEVGILSHPHIGEVLVRERLEDGAGHFGHTAFGIVAVVELARLPLAVFAADVVG